MTAAVLLVGLDDDRVEVAAQADVDRGAVGLRDLDLPDRAVLGITLDRIGLAATGLGQRRRDRTIGLGTGDVAILAAATPTVRFFMVVLLLVRVPPGSGYR